jgi:hypothetical protein
MQMVHLMFRNVAAIVADQDVRVKSILDHVRDTSDYIGVCTERQRSLQTAEHLYFYSTFKEEIPAFCLAESRPKLSFSGGQEN